MNDSKHTAFSIGLTSLVMVLAISAPGAPLSAGAPILLDQTRGGFDFIRVDPSRHRLLLAHTGNKTLDVVDVEAKRLLKSVPTGAAQDSAVDTKNGRYYVAVSAPPRMVIIDANRLEVSGEVALPAAADLMTFNPANGLAYVCNDEAAELWVIDPEAKKILSTITLEGKGMEDLTLDPQNKRLFQVVKGGNALVVIDPSNNKILSSWTTAPATNPHGLALVAEPDSILVAGGNGKLVLMDRSTGQVLANTDIAPRVDEMAYDPQLHTAYCASGQGKISVVSVTAGKLNALGDVPTAAAIKSIVVDPRTHTVWVAYSKADQSFAQPFVPAK